MFTDREIDEKCRDKWNKMNNEDAILWLVNHGYDKIEINKLSLQDLHFAFLNAYATHLKSRDFSKSLEFSHD